MFVDVLEDSYFHVGCLDTETKERERIIMLGMEKEEEEGEKVYF